MRDRLPALDGLRGFAAMSVVLGHAAIWNLAPNQSLIQLILIAFSAAHNAVQILFVLSGFLIAYLYPSVHSTSAFIKKRYARILPIYGVVVIFLWILSITNFPWYIQLATLLLLAVALNRMWTFIGRFSRLRSIGTIIFYSFVTLQILVLLFNITYVQHYIVPNNIVLPSFQQNLLVMLTNLTLTHQLVKGINALSGVFWSLGAEMLFYIVYPFIVVPIIHIAKKGGIIISVLCIVAVTKILLDLDSTVMSIAGLNGMNIARANGFVAGVTIGTIYQSQGVLWQKIKPYLEKPFFGIIALSLLVLVQMGEHIVGLGSIGFMNVFYLITSWLIAIVILNATIPNTLVNKLFRPKGIVFLGVISYSLYLTHGIVSPWSKEIEKIFIPFFTSKTLIDVVSLGIYLVICIVLSYILFRTVEYLYFLHKKKVLVTTLASIEEKTKDIPSRRVAIVNTIVIVGIFFILSLLYSGMYSPTLLVNRHTTPFTSYFPPKEESLLTKNVTIPFTAQQKNLSVISVDMRYEGSAGLTRIEKTKPAVLQFELLDQNNKVTFKSVRSAFEVEGSPRFQFGFPTIEQSKNKQYSVRISLKQGKEKDNVLIDASPTSFVSIYTITKSEILRNPFQLVINRSIFLLSNPSYIFLLLFVLFLLLLAKKQASRTLTSTILKQW